MRNYKYTLLKELQLLHIIFQNEVTFESIKELKRGLNINTEFKTYNKILIDLRFSKLDMTFNEVKRISNCIHKNTKQDNYYMFSFLTKTPEQVAKMMIYSLNMNNKNQYYNNVFSTLEASLDHLNIETINFEMINAKQKIKSF